MSNQNLYPCQYCNKPHANLTEKQNHERMCSENKPVPISYSPSSPSFVLEQLDKQQNEEDEQDFKRDRGRLQVEMANEGRVEAFLQSQVNQYRSVLEGNDI